MSGACLCSGEGYAFQGGARDPPALDARVGTGGVEYQTFVFIEIAGGVDSEREDAAFMCADIVQFRAGG